MFSHIFTYRLKCLFRDKQLIFWTLMFPLLLAILFNMAFSNLNSGETFKAFHIAIVNDAQYQSNTTFKQALNAVSQGEDRMFNLTEASKEEADKLLRDKKITGYIIVENPIRLVVSKSGLRQNIMKSFIDNYIQTAATVNTLLEAGLANPQSFSEQIGEYRQYVKEVSGTSAKPNNVLIYFYSLIAMACLYGGFFGMREITDIQADISSLAARINTAPVHKLKAFVYSMSVSLFIHLTQMFVLLLFLRFVFKIEFGSRTGFVVLTTMVGSITGLSFGAIVSALVKKSEGIKVGILISVSMTGSFLAGMMYQNMKYIIAKNVPILSYLNPVNLLTDAFYSLYYYDSLSRYTLNIALLCVFIVIFCSATYFIIRRRKYASL